MTTSFGSFFDLELPRETGGEYHRGAARFNMARSALRAILRARKIARIWLPKYVCPVVPEAAKAEGVGVEWYSVDRSLTPAIDEVPDGETALYVNYFGLNADRANRVAAERANVVLDNSQAFFAKPRAGVDAIYSPRKWFGVPDGGYAYCSVPLERFPRGESTSRTDFLLARLQSDSPEGIYSAYRDAEDRLRAEPPLEMSTLTRRLLERIDYATVISRRRRNYAFLRDALRNRNELDLPELGDADVPMFFPFLVGDPSLRGRLIEKKAFVATLWRGVESWAGEESDEAYLTRFLLPLPLDQRYVQADMERLVELVVDALAPNSNRTTESRALDSKRETRESR